jgi:Family of unknown function (DUF5681)
MNSRQPPRGTIMRRRRQHPAGDDVVGYGRPPRAHQFRPGQSGNPRGRPKGAKNEATILHELLNRKINIREAGASRKISILEGILLRFTEDALKGNVKTAAFLFNRYSAIGAAETESESKHDFSDDDRKVLDAFVRRIESKRER